MLVKQAEVVNKPHSISYTCHGCFSWSNDQPLVSTTVKFGMSVSNHSITDLPLMGGTARPTYREST